LPAPILTLDESDNVRYEPHAPFESYATIPACVEPAPELQSEVEVSIAPGAALEKHDCLPPVRSRMPTAYEFAGAAAKELVITVLPAATIPRATAPTAAEVLADRAFDARQPLVSSEATFQVAVTAFQTIR